MFFPRLPLKLPFIGQSKPLVAVVRLQGVIGMPNSVRPNLSLATVSPLLERAFKTKHAKAVAIVINSPGGSPVQSHLLFRRIRELAERHERQVLTFVEDVAASGGYMIALAGDEIFADPSSILGSIGVISSGFGFSSLIEKWGIERRVHTSGDRKSLLDPFCAEKSEDIAHLSTLQKDIHKHFIDLVKMRRGDKLLTSDELYSGLFWAGDQARQYGLIDAIGELRPTLRERYGEDVRFKMIEMRRGPFARRLGTDMSAPERLAEALPSAAISALEERSIWARFGL